MLKKIRNIGVGPHLSDEQSSILRLINDAILICILFTLTDATSTLIAGNLSTSYFTFVFTGMFIFSLILNYFQKYYFSRLFLIVIVGFLLLVQAFLFGDTIDLSNIFVVLFVFVIVVFERDKTSLILCSFYVFTIYFIKNWIIKNLEHPLAHKGMIYAKEVYFVLSLILVTVLILRVLKRKDNFINLSQSLLKDLEKNNNALQESNDRLKSFAYATSHDLKTPLRNVANYIELLGQKIGSSKDEKLDEYIKMTKKGVGLMNESISDILTLSSLDYDSEKWEDINLNEILDEIKFNYQVSLENETLIIESNSLPILKGNKTQLFVLFQNLIDNSIKYNDNATVQISIDGEMSEEGASVVFSDNGIGIDSEYASYIFEPFKRLHSNSKFEGTGLGLAIAKKIMDSHSGSIELVQENNMPGSKFKLRFPNRPD